MRTIFKWLGSPSYKLRLIMAGYALVLAIFIGLGWRTKRQLDAEIEAQRSVNHTYQVLLELTDLFSDLKDAETGERGFLITGDKQYLEPYTAALKTIHQRWSTLQTMTKSNAPFQARLAAMSPLIDSKLAEMQHTIDLRRNRGFEAAATEVDTHKGKQWMDQLRLHIALAQVEEQARLRQRTATMRNNRKTLELLLLLGTIGCVGLLGMLVLVVGKGAAEMAMIHRSLLSRYGMAVAMSGLVSVGLWLLNLVCGGRGPPLVAIGLAVAVAGWWGGLGPGLLTTALCGLFDWWALLLPAHSGHLPELREGLRLLIAVFSGAVISALAEAMHRAARLQQLTAAWLEETVAHRTTELRANVEELEHFSYSIAHDMRAPLRAMRSFSTLLLRQCGHCLQTDGREYMRRIAVAAERMDHLIVDALDYSKALRGVLPLGPVDPDLLLRNMLESYPDLQPGKADIRIEGALPPVLANSAGLTQCFSNLLTNAVKFVAAGVLPQVRISAEMRGDRVRLWFADNGIGIPPEFQARLFQMFERASRDYEGTGIGLALVRKVTQRMGGQVGVVSEPGHGSRFWIELKEASPS